MHHHNHRKSDKFKDSEWSLKNAAVQIKDLEYVKFQKPMAKLIVIFEDEFYIRNNIQNMIIFSINPDPRNFRLGRVSSMRSPHSINLENKKYL
jgi:hypothetical protein